MLEIIDKKNIQLHQKKKELLKFDILNEYLKLNLYHCHSARKIHSGSNFNLFLKKGF